MKEETFNLYGSNWTVKYADEIAIDKEEGFQFGITDHVNRVICVSTKDRDGNQMPDEEIELTKLHELIHCILGTGMYAQASGDEPMVEWLARSIYSLRKQEIIK